MNSEYLINEFKQIYGPEKGTQIFMNVMPGIFADFSKLAKKAKPGTIIKEDYILEDHKATLRLSAKAGSIVLSDTQAIILRSI